MTAQVLMGMRWYKMVWWYIKATLAMIGSVCYWIGCWNLWFERILLTRFP